MSTEPPHYRSSAFMTTGLQLITSPPPADSPLAYNEDEITSLITQIYNMLLRISYLSPSDVVFPPADTSRHLLDTALFHNKVHIGTQVISLLERLPYIRVDLPLPVFYEAIPYDYTEDTDTLQHVIETRDPDTWNRWNQGRKGPHRRYLRPEDVALTYPTDAGPEGATWILDVEANSIRILDDTCEPPVPGVTDGVPSTFQLERPTEPHHYRNFPAFHAPTVLRRHIEKLRSLELLPFDGWIHICDESIQNIVIARKLRQEYGWPDKFKADKWAEDQEQVGQESLDEEETALDGAETWEDRFAATQRWIQEHPAPSTGDD